MTTRRAFLGTATAVGAVSLLGNAPAAAASSNDSTVPTGSTAATEQQARDAIIAVDTDMQKYYDALRAEVTLNLSPVIVVYNDYAGGLYTLVHNGQQISEHPVSEIFQLAKSVAHAPLGIYSILSPYLDNRVPNLPNADHLDAHDLQMVASKGPATTEWVTPLQAFAATLAGARRQLAAANMPQELQDSSARILDAALRFIAGAVQAGSFDMKSFEDFSGSVFADIGTNMDYAAQVQIAGVKDIMTRWRQLVGEKDWSDLYTVVMTIWTTSVLNQNSIILKQYMNPAKLDSHLINIEMAQFPADPVAVALDNLARIVQDNVAAEMVFPLDQTLADALKGPEDLLAATIQQQLVCPFRSKQALVTKPARSKA
ncbi:hypothetical protein P3T37_002283 [Kitasatospora sp. MAA4]|uniref:hypothetical protein n=1 Tax=Kitasatospora sp. MAA4 TaxID=3035093 RepID=UPI00247397C2|nr:hypothetical protein [Kitasatospora sp. MAA4]MDH6132897.1 hypothetical protein [Kitasatospora sp. MAA4]